MNASVSIAPVALVRRNPHELGIKKSEDRLPEGPAFRTKCKGSSLPWRSGMSYEAGCFASSLTDSFCLSAILFPEGGPIPCINAAAAL